MQYEHNGTLCEMHCAKSAKSDAPTIMIFHAWRGRDSFVCDKADELAKQGYHAVAIDLYGKDVLGSDNDECAALMTPFMEDRAMLRSRIEAAVAAVCELPHVNPNKLAAIGYCFGGLCALDLARSGADVRGVVSFHGLLAAPNWKAEKVQAKVLVLHGDNDPMVPPEQVAAFQEEMREAKADWQTHVYGGAYHAFTNPEANDPDFGTVYSPLFEKRAYQTMHNFLEELFA